MAENNTDIITTNEGTEIMTPPEPTSALSVESQRIDADIQIAQIAQAGETRRAEIDAYVRLKEIELEHEKLKVQARSDDSERDLRREEMHLRDENEDDAREMERERQRSEREMHAEDRDTDVRLQQSAEQHELNMGKQRFNHKWLPVIVAICLVVVILLGALISRNNYRKGKIKFPKINSGEKNYEIVANQLEEAGFINIEIKPDYNIAWWKNGGPLDERGNLASITVNGNAINVKKAGDDYYPRDSKIIVYYHAQPD